MEGGAVQIELLEDSKYVYRIFVTNLTKKAHQVIDEYDKRAGAENLIGEAKREGLAAIPSRKFANNYFMEYLDRRRKEVRQWLDRPKWLCRHLVALGLSPAI